MRVPGCIGARLVQPLVQLIEGPGLTLALLLQRAGIVEALAHGRAGRRPRHTGSGPRRSCRPCRRYGRRRRHASRTASPVGRISCWPAEAAIGAGPRCLGAPPPAPAVRRRRDVQHRLLRQFLADQAVADQAGEKEGDASDQNRGNALVDLHSYPCGVTSPVPLGTDPNARESASGLAVARAPCASIRCAHHRETTITHQPTRNAHN